MIKNMELAQVRRGESFILDGVKFVKLDEDAHASFVLTADVFPKHIPFEHKDAERKDHDNFVGSYLQKHVDIWLHQGHPNISKAVVERPINLLSMCGETVYGTPCVFGRVLTLDEYRRYRKYIPLASDWYWLATSYSPIFGSYNYAYRVNADGSVGHLNVYYGNGCARPALYLESSILVSVEVETDDIEKMQDKVTALQRETLTACKTRSSLLNCSAEFPAYRRIETMCSKLYADGELAATPYETDKVLRHRELCMGLNVLYAKKNHDYGDSFHQTYIEEGMAMPRIRLGDKFSRFKTLSRILSSDSDQQAVTDESIRDTLLDLANYSIMTVLEIDDAQHEQEIAEQKTCDEGASNAD